MEEGERKRKERWSWRRRAAHLTLVGASVLQHGLNGLCQTGITL